MFAKHLLFGNNEISDPKMNPWIFANEQFLIVLMLP